VLALSTYTFVFSTFIIVISALTVFKIWKALRVKWMGMGMRLGTRFRTRFRFMTFSIKEFIKSIVKFSGLCLHLLGLAADKLLATRKRAERRAEKSKDANKGE